MTVMHQIWYKNGDHLINLLLLAIHKALKNEYIVAKGNNSFGLY